MRKTRAKYNSSLSSTRNQRIPTARTYLRKKLIGGARSFTEFLDSNFIPPEMRKIKPVRRRKPKTVIETLDSIIASPAPGTRTRKKRVVKGRKK